MVKVLVVISVYKNIPFLKKVLDSIAIQTYEHFEVAVVEDGNFSEMAEFLDGSNYHFPIHHYTQEDIGFRKNKILNQAIRSATQDLVLFIDGDCILRPNFIEKYVSFYHPNTILFAKRVDLDKKTTDLLLNSATIVPRIFTLLKNNSKRIEDGIHLPFKPVKVTARPTMIGCNMGIPLKALKEINGFDEDYQHAGYGEDCDIEWRLQQAGYVFKNLKFHVIQYHLYHDRPNREEETALSRALFNQKKASGKIACSNGIETLD
jgi:cellulose synthase/poly-beta-1,6-N-acetylglucosamine synthase-like glycosyltransferase